MQRFNELRLSSRLHDDLPLKVWNINGTIVLPTADFDQFLEETQLSITEISERAIKVHNFLGELGWLLNNPGNIMLDYANESAQAILDAQISLPKEAPVPDSFLKGIKPFTIDSLGLTFEQIILVYPKVFLEVMNKFSKDLRKCYSLHVLTHEFAHAFGVSDARGEQKIEQLELMADAVAFRVGFNKDSPNDYYTFFGYLGTNLAINENEESGNDKVLDSVEKILQKMRQDPVCSTE